MAEITLRLIGIGYPLFQQWDEELGWAPIPGDEGTYTDEGRAYIRINHAGYRDREHAVEKPPRTIRIAVLGDSYTEAFQVPLEQTYWWLTGERLADCRAAASQKVEILNFGVYAYGTAQELLTLRTRVWRYQPDVILLLFTTGNDVRDNSRELRQDPRRPYFVESAGRLVLDESFRAANPLRDPFKRLYYEAVARSRIAQLVHRARYLILNDPTTPAAQEQALGGGPRLDLAYTEPGTPEARSAWRITETLLSTMNAEVRQQGASFVLVVGTNPVEVHPDPDVRRKTMEDLGVTDLAYSVRRLRDLGERQGFDVVPLLDPFMEFVGRTGTPLHGFDGSGVGHWNQVGHRLAAQVVADELCSRLPRLLRQ